MAYQFNVGAIFRHGGPLAAAECETRPADVFSRHSAVLQMLGGHIGVRLRLDFRLQNAPDREVKRVHFR
jgi:hypothetical protein